MGGPGFATADSGESLVGRERELGEIESLLASESLVTLTGLGGSGKTALAAEIARRFEAAGKRISLVDLAPISEPSGLASAVATAVGARETAMIDLSAAILSELRLTGRTLVLDNFEHLLPAAPFVSWLLDQVPSLRVVATSRVALGLPGEVEFRLGPLQVPTSAADIEDAPASRVFLRRAGLPAVERLAPDEQAAVAEICSSLDGMPLALELAAAWSSILSPRAIRRRLESGALRLDRSGDDRQASLTRIIEATLDLVTPADAAVFDRLGAFVGGFDEAAASAVVGSPEVLVNLRALAGVALIQVSATADGEPLFRLLEVIRTVARTRLARDPTYAAIRRRHAEHFADRAEAAADRLRTHTFGDALAGARLADPNLQTAFESAVAERDAPLAVRIAASLASGAMRAGTLREGEARVRAALELGELPPGIRADGLNAIVSLRDALGMPRIVALAEEAVALAQAAQDPVREVRTLITLANVGPVEDGPDLWRRASELARGINFWWGLATAQVNLGANRAGVGELAEALAAFREAQTAYALADDAVGAAMATSDAAEMLAALGEEETAAGELRRAIPVLRDAAPAMLIVPALAALAILAVRAGDQADALILLAECGHAVTRSESGYVASDFFKAAAVVLADGHPIEAARALGACDPDGLWASDRTFLEAASAGLAKRLGSQRLVRELGAGRRLESSVLFSQVTRAVDAENPELTLRLRAKYEGFTPREAEVLRLVAEGRTDPEIAERLGMKSKTASVHVANIKAKLGIENRVEAALMARRLLDDAEARKDV